MSTWRCVLGGDWPDALPDDELGLPASGDSRRLLLLVPPQSRWSGSLAVEECDEFACFVLDGFYSGGNGAYIERTGGTQRSLPDDELGLPASRHWRLLQRVHDPGSGQLSRLLAGSEHSASG